MHARPSVKCMFSWEWQPGLPSVHFWKWCYRGPPALPSLDCVRYFACVWRWGGALLKILERSWYFLVSVLQRVLSTQSRVFQKSALISVSNPEATGVWKNKSQAESSPWPFSAGEIVLCETFVAAEKQCCPAGMKHRLQCRERWLWHSVLYCISTLVS